jgi:hypothetical protein
MPEISKRLIAAQKDIAEADSPDSQTAVSDSRIPSSQLDSQQSSGQDLSAFNENEAEQASASAALKLADQSSQPAADSQTGEAKDNGAVNQEAPEVPVKPGEPVNFEGETPYKRKQQISDNSSMQELRNAHTSGVQANQLRTQIRARNSNTPHRRAYQTSYTY